MKQINMMAEIPDEILDGKIKQDILDLIQKKYGGVMKEIIISKAKPTGAGLSLGDL